ncbi:MAG: hypothetical protein EXS36_13935 [Pedosphaera sp.]|nr:hypothetical protein [Pedosphaera sp.]
MVGSANGKRQIRKFSDLKRAKAEALRVVIAIGNSDGMVAALDSADASDLVCLKEKIGPLGVTLQGWAIRRRGESLARSWQFGTGGFPTLSGTRNPERCGEVLQYLPSRREVIAGRFSTVSGLF